jgi:multicomponent Na+:H+ antiporter subunit B
MVELYLRVIDRVLTPLLLVISIVLFLRGHNMPGGGFIAALLASAAIALQILSYGALIVRRRVGPFLQPAIGIGLLLAVSSAIFGILTDGAFFRSVWTTFTVFGQEIEIGTPVFFDLGVFLTVVGVTVSFLLGLSESVFVAPRIRLHLDRNEPEEPQP